MAQPNHEYAKPFRRLIVMNRSVDPNYIVAVNAAATAAGVTMAVAAQVRKMAGLQQPQRSGLVSGGAALGAQ